MLIGQPLCVVFVLASVACCAGGASAAQVLKKEPAMGKLREGQMVLVDDGTCPAGQIKQVTGGNHVRVGGTRQVERHRKCVPR
jgi:hypothetical protein